jgi:hypothetical protein
MLWLCHAGPVLHWYCMLVGCYAATHDDKLEATPLKLHPVLHASCLAYIHVLSYVY